MIKQVVVYKVVDKIQLKHLYLVYHISRFCIPNLLENKNLHYLSKKVEGLDGFYHLARETVASRRFMRGTDPIKSTWVYPKLIL